MCIAFIIPIHKRHFGHIYNIINNIKLPIDMFLVFSNLEESESFGKKDKVKHLILPEGVKTESIVTYKKFYGLEQLKNDEKYKYFIVCDSEIKLIEKNLNVPNMMSKIENIFKNKKIYAGKTNTNKYHSLGVMINDLSSNLFHEKQKLKEITEDYSLYYWWSEIPVYERSHLNDFFTKIKYKEIELNYLQFDYIIYSNYLLLFKNFELINLSEKINLDWSLELYETDKVENLITLKNNDYSFSFVLHKMYNQHKKFYDDNGTFIIYHLDR